MARFREPLRVTLLRTGLIGLVVGVIAASAQRRPASWPQWTAAALWFSFGGHWIELFFLNWLRPRLAPARWVQVIGRLVTWPASAPTAHISKVGWTSLSE